jgi:hypothetical protein
MSSNLKFIAIILTLALMMFALAYVATPGRSRLAVPASTTSLMPAARLAHQSGGLGSRVQISALRPTKSKT